MAHLILHKDGAYNIYSTIVDGPMYETALTLKQLEEAITEKYGEAGMRELPERLAKAHKTGCSAPGSTLEGCISANSAGTDEPHMATAEFIAKFLTLTPNALQDTLAQTAGNPLLAGAPPPIDGELLLMSDETLQFWIDAYSNPGSGPSFTGHAMLVRAAKEYQAIRELIGAVATLDVAAERNRQIEVEMWEPANDDKYRRGELADAAACYAANAAGAVWTTPVPKAWPWPKEKWKPKTARQDLVRAGALILAEIERLDRLATPSLEGN